MKELKCWIVACRNINLSLPVSCFFVLFCFIVSPADGDPHFVIDLPRSKMTICFNIDGQPGDILRLVSDHKYSGKGTTKLGVLTYSVKRVGGSLAWPEGVDGKETLMNFHLQIRSWDRTRFRVNLGQFQTRKQISMAFPLLLVLIPTIIAQLWQEQYAVSGRQQLLHQK